MSPTCAGALVLEEGLGAGPPQRVGGGGAAGCGDGMPHRLHVGHQRGGIGHGRQLRAVDRSRRRAAGGRRRPAGEAEGEEQDRRMGSSSGARVVGERRAPSAPRPGGRRRPRRDRRRPLDDLLGLRVEHADGLADGGGPSALPCRVRLTPPTRSRRRPSRPWRSRAGRRGRGPRRRAPARSGLRAAMPMTASGVAAARRRAGARRRAPRHVGRRHHLAGRACCAA